MIGEQRLRPALGEAVETRYATALRRLDGSEFMGFISLTEVDMLRQVTLTQKVVAARWAQIPNCIEVSTF